MNLEIEVFKNEKFYNDAFIYKIIFKNALMYTQTKHQQQQQNIRFPAEEGEGAWVFFVQVKK